MASTLHAAYLADQHPHEMDPPDVEFMIFALDLLSGLIQGLGPVMAPLISQSEPKLLSLLDVCVRVSHYNSFHLYMYVYTMYSLVCLY